MRSSDSFRPSSDRLLKKAYLRGPILRTGTPPATPLAAAYLQHAWTQLRWVPRLRRAALHPDLFEQPDGKRILIYTIRGLGGRHPVRSEVQHAETSTGDS